MITITIKIIFVGGWAAPQSVGGQKIRVFPSPATISFFISSLSQGSSRGILVVLRRADRGRTGGEQNKERQKKEKKHMRKKKEKEGKKKVKKRGSKKKKSGVNILKKIKKILI